MIDNEKKKCYYGGVKEKRRNKNEVSDKNQFIFTEI